jgi:hypothetical protein
MRKLAALCFIFAIAGCASTGVVVKKVNPDQIIHYSQLQKEWEKVGGMYNPVAYVDKGETIPMEISFDNDLIGLKDKKVDFILKERIYFRFENLSGEEWAALRNLDEEKLSKMSDAEKGKYLKNLMLSTDAIHWAQVVNRKAMKELLGIKGGSIAVGLGMTKEGGIKSTLKIKTTK